MSSGTVWTSRMDQKLRERWITGLRSVEIAAELGVSKNAVVGRAHRLHLPPRPSPIKLAGTGARPRSLRGKGNWHPRSSKMQAPKLPPIDNSLKARLTRYFESFGTNGHACAAVIGDPRQHEHCDLPALNQHAYCLEHAVAYLRPFKLLPKRGVQQGNADIEPRPQGQVGDGATDGAV